MGHRESIATSHAFSTLEARSAVVSGVVMRIQCHSWVSATYLQSTASVVFFLCCAMAVHAERVRWGKHSVKDWPPLKWGMLVYCLPVPRRAVQRSLSSRPDTSGGLLPAVWKLWHWARLLCLSETGASTRHNPNRKRKAWVWSSTEHDHILGEKQANCIVIVTAVLKGVMRW